MKKLENYIIKKSLCPVTATAELIGKFDLFYRLIEEYNEHTNITAIEGRDETEVKHFIDSLTAAEFLEGERIIDIGAGAGFPSVPLALLETEKKFTLIESVRKKTDFINSAVEKLTLKNIEAVKNIRIEDFKEREAFDTAVMRAVAHLRTALEYAVPFVKKNGIVIAYKGAGAEDEVKESEQALKTLGARVEKIVRIDEEGLDKRCLVLVRKEKETDSKFPRSGNKPRLKPL